MSKFLLYITRFGLFSEDSASINQSLPWQIWSLAQVQSTPKRLISCLRLMSLKPIRFLVAGKRPLPLTWLIDLLKPALELKTTLSQSAASLHKTFLLP